MPRHKKLKEDRVLVENADGSVARTVGGPTPHDPDRNKTPQRTGVDANSPVPSIVLGSAANQITPGARVNMPSGGTSNISLGDFQDPQRKAAALDVISQDRIATQGANTPAPRPLSPLEQRIAEKAEENSERLVRMRDVFNKEVLGRTGITRPTLAQQSVNRLELGQSGPKSGSILGQDLARRQNRIKGQRVAKGEAAKKSLEGLSSFGGKVPDEEIANRLTGKERAQFFSDTQSKSTADIDRANKVRQKFASESKKQERADRRAEAKAEAQREAEQLAAGELAMFKEKEGFKQDNRVDLLKKQFDVNTVEGKRKFGEELAKMALDEKFEIQSEKREREADKAGRKGDVKFEEDKARARERGRLSGQAGFERVRTAEGNEVTGGETVSSVRPIDGTPNEGGESAPTEFKGQALSNKDQAFVDVIQNSDPDRVKRILSDPALLKSLTPLQREIIDDMFSGQ